MGEDVTALLETCVASRRGHTDVELELRLGTRTDSFQAGVPRYVFQQLERDFIQTPELIADSGYTEVVDYFYTLSNGINVRTRVHYDSTRMQLSTEHVSKHVLHSFVAAVSGDPGDTCRVEVSQESVVDRPPQSTLINYVRIKQRRVFVDHRGDGGDAWRYELSRTWSGITRDAVEYNQRHSEPTYEVECELVDTKGAYMGERTDAQVSKSLHLKMLMLLGHDDVGTPLEISHVKNNNGARRGGEGGKRVRYHRQN